MSDTEQETSGAAEGSTRKKDENTVERLKRVRGGNRAVVTKLEREANEIIRRHGNALNTELIAKMESWAATLKKKQELISNLDEQILMKCDMADIENEIEETSEISAKIDEILTKMDACRNGNYLFEAEHPRTPQRSSTPPPTQGSSLTPTSPPFVPSNALNQSGSAASSASNTIGIRLPKISLPKFSGDITKFRSFWQSFKCSVDDNEQLSPVHKMTYLSSSLEGAAYQVVEGMELTEENYAHAIETLQTRFGKSQSIINAHMKALLHLECNPGSMSQLRNLYDKINVQVRGLHALGISSEQYGALLIPVIMTRLPSDIALEVSRKTEEDIWRINDVMEIIRKEIEAREMSEKIISEKRKFEKSTKPRSSSPIGSTKTFYTRGASHQKRNPECYFCKKDHYSNKCTEITNIQDRKKILMETKRCFNCLKIGHQAQVCSSSSKCYICQKKHNTAICNQRRGGDEEKPEKRPEKESEKAVTATSNERKDVLLQTANTYAFGEDRSKKVAVNVLFDSGSQKSYVTEDLKKKLNLKVEKTETLNLNTFGSEKYCKKSCDKVSVNLEVGEETVPISALSFPQLCSPLSSRVDVRSYPHLQGLSLADTAASSDKPISVIIGVDHYYDIVQGEIRKGSTGPVAISSKLGWLLSGPVVSCNGNEISSCSNIVSNLAVEILPSTAEVTNESREIVDALSEFWKHESSGLHETNENGENETNKAEKAKIEMKDGRYEVSLPWKDEILQPLPSDFDMCRRRLESLFARLKTKPEVLRQYDDIFREQLSTGIIEKVPPEEVQQETAHYLCHFGVARDDRSTTKLRIVFDGSAKSDKDTLSLNDRLEVGGNYMPLLFDTLIRFRTHPIAITADIEKAFLQIEIKEADRDTLRFLWYDDIKKPDPTIVQFRYRRLLFGLSCSPALLGQTIRHHVAKFENQSPEVVKLLSRLYADDLSCGAENREDALEIYCQAKEIMAKGGFNLRKWNTNDKVLLEEITSLENKGKKSTVTQGDQVDSDNGKKLKEPEVRHVIEDDQTYSQYAIGTPLSKGDSKVLGVNWDSDSDKLLFDLDNVVAFAKSLPPTKRSVLKLAAKIFDPLGMLTVFTINLKIFFQQLCIEKLNWDVELEGSHRKTYDSFVSEIESLQGISISRSLFQKDKQVRKVEMHGFSDASERAYASVVYLRVEYESGEIEIKFIASKSKVCPIKSQSIPRLELLGALLLSKLVNSVREILKDELKDLPVETFYWIDSISALCWIRNVKPWTQYVRHRVSKILESSSREQWFHCPGLQNPADLPSRGKYGNLAANLFWWEGPGFLKLDSREWPKAPCGSELEIEVAMKEKLKTEPNITHAMVTSERGSQPHIEKVVELERFSDKGKLLRTMAWVVRFVSNLKRSVNKEELNKEKMVSVTEINAAEIILVRSIQGEFFPNEISYLLTSPAGKKHIKCPLYVNQFNLYLDTDGILRCRTRVGKASIPDSSKKPILLPAKSRYSTLVILDCHEKVFHNGTRETLNLLRQKYWVLRGREQVKYIIRRCILCRKLEGLPFKYTFCPDLPEFRVDESPPFSHVGVDFAGPLIVSDKTQQVDQDTSKCYVCLFTCASTRAVHLELVENLTVEAFIRAFRRFCARRGLPATIISDNAKTFKSASKEIKKLLRSPRLKEYLTLKGVKWRFIVELAPFQGGYWERLVRSTKRCLVKVIGRALLKFDEMSTILVEIESVINSRPLTYVYDDSEGISYPLTPSHLINGRNLDRLPNDAHFEIVNTYESLSKRARYNRRLLTQFTTSWKREYLLGLLEAYKPKDNANEPVIKVNDIVILRNEQVKRSFWKLCKVVELLTGTDGTVRSARVQVAGGKKVFNRSLKHLIPLEIRNMPAQQETQQQQPAQQAPPQQPPQQQLQSVPAQRAARRNAAVIGEIARRDNVIK